MSSLYSTKDAKDIGKGKHSPANSVTDKALAVMVAGYKKGIASHYRSLIPEDFDETVIKGSMLVSRKVDGEQWCMVLDSNDCFIANPAGRVLSGNLPVLTEAKKACKKIKGRTVLAGELYAQKDSGRIRHGDLAQALSDGEADRLGFAVFDLVEGGDDKAQAPIHDYPDRLEVLERIVGKGGKHFNVVQTEKVDNGIDGITHFFQEWVEKENAEGLVARSDSGITYKVKPAITVDAAVIGYTLRTEDDTQVSSFLCALMREDGHFQIIGHCGNLGAEGERRKLLKMVDPMGKDSNYREASSKGALYKFIEPKIVAEVRINDIQAEKADGDMMPRMVLAYEKEEWKALRVMPGVSVLAPRLVRIRDDKTIDHKDIPLSQVLDRVLLPDVHSAVTALELPPSELVRREVYTKTTKGSMAVRKLVVWKSNKEDISEEFPAYVVHWTDYSANRKDPLQRTVRLAPNEALANEIADELILDGQKRGWSKV
jgi:hypothetical protein